MKRTIQSLVTASACSVLALTALGQQSQQPPAFPPNPADSALERAHPTFNRPGQLLHTSKASDLIGMTVKNLQGDKLGKVDELAVDVESGALVQVILSVGGIAGVGNTLVAVPPGALHHDTAQKVLHLDATREKLKDAPRFDNSMWKDGFDAAHLSANYTYYGQESIFGIDKSSKPDAGRPDGRNTISTRRPDGTWETRFADDQPSSRQAQLAKYPAPELGRIQKASKVIGTPVKNLLDDKLGKIENIVADLGSGRMVALIVSSGGFFGLGDELSAVPPMAFKFNADRDTLQLDASKETFANAPHFKDSQWPNFSEPGYAESVYRSYNVEPYFTYDTSTRNTGVNVQDRDHRTLTPIDQSNTRSDLQITAQIRKEIVAQKNMSSSAYNVKIITANGHVTLRGPVDTTDEKRIIGDIANRVASNVDNQLVVTLAPTGR